MILAALVSARKPKISQWVGRFKSTSALCAKLVADCAPPREEQPRIAAARGSERDLFGLKFTLLGLGESKLGRPVRLCRSKTELAAVPGDAPARLAWVSHGRARATARVLHSRFPL